MSTALLTGLLSSACRSTAGQRRERIPFDPTDYEASTKAFLKLTGSLQTETVRRWFTGQVYAYRPGEATIPLFYLDGFYLEDYEQQPDGTHLMTRHEITIKRDLRSGDLLQEWANPLTGRRDIVENSVGGPQQKIYNSWGFDNPKYPRTEEDPLELEWMIHGDDVWVTWDLFLRFKNPLQPDKYPLKSSGKMLDLVNLTNYKGNLADIEDPNMHNAPGVMFWNGISSWAPFMRMGQTPGSLVYKAIGLKVDRFTDLPSHVLDAAELAFPGHLTEQVPWKPGNYSWFDENEDAEVPERWVNE